MFQVEYLERYLRRAIFGLRTSSWQFLWLVCPWWNSNSTFSAASNMAIIQTKRETGTLFIWKHMLNVISLHSVCFCLDVFENVTDSEEILLHNGLNPRVLFHLEHRLVAVELQIGDFRRYYCQAVILDVQLTQTCQLSDFAWEFKKVIIATTKLKLL